MKVEPYYRTDIKTDEDLIKWLREKDDSLRVRNPYRKKPFKRKWQFLQSPFGIMSSQYTEAKKILKYYVTKGGKIKWQKYSEEQMVLVPSLK